MGAAFGKSSVTFLLADVDNIMTSGGHLLTSLNCSPFVQRVWIALEAKGFNYQYIEVDPYKKPESLLQVNPRGLVPALKHGDWGCGESTVIMEYVRTLF